MTPYPRRLIEVDLPKKRGQVLLFASFQAGKVKKKGSNPLIVSCLRYRPPAVTTARPNRREYPYPNGHTR